MQEIKADLLREAVDEVIRARHSVRAYLDTPVPRALVEDILSIAARSPSGTNTQPWNVHVVAGDVLQRLITAVCAVFDANPEHCEPGYDEVYLRQYGEPYQSRRRQLGKALYGLMGIGKGDTAAMLAQRRRNFLFFGAPVGLLFTIDRSFGRGSWADVGMFMQTLMLAARARGLDTCPQAYWVDYESVVAPVIGWPENQRLVSGMALGYADPDAPENRLVSERAGIGEFAVFHGLA